MKKIITSFTLAISTFCFGQTNIDTLAFQDFEVVPATPVWNFTGPVVYNSGTSSPTAAPANSPIGINASRAWETTTQSGGLVLDFDNVIIPAGYDSILFEFRLAAMNLNGSSGGPDDLDYVLVEYSTDNGANYYGRLRIRGAAANNGFWEYAATGVGKVYYQPTTEVVFQPANTGLATTDGYSTNGITFPGSVTQVKIRMTGRSSSSTDTWLVDNVLLTGVNTVTTDGDELATPKVTIYPNPSNGIVNVNAKNIDGYEVFDMLGNKIKSISKESIIDLKDYSEGIYFVKFYSFSGIVTQKIVKQ